MIPNPPAGKKKLGKNIGEPGGTGGGINVPANMKDPPGKKKLGKITAGSGGTGGRGDVAGGVGGKGGSFTMTMAMQTEYEVGDIHVGEGGTGGEGKIIGGAAGAGGDAKITEVFILSSGGLQLPDFVDSLRATQ